MAEEHIQRRIFDDPTILNGAWDDPADAPRWVFAVYEMPVHIDDQQTQNDLFLDVLLVDDEAVPTLVETKLSSNIGMRRNIVGQILEYATFARLWNIGNLRWDYEHPDPERINVIAPIADPDAFWGQLRKNLDDGRMTLMLAADDFPTETEEVIKFLHERTDTNLEVLAHAPEGFAGLAAHQRQERSQRIDQAHPRHQARSSNKASMILESLRREEDISMIFSSEMTEASIPQQSIWEHSVTVVLAKISAEHRPSVERLLGIAEEYAAMIYSKGDAITVRASTGNQYQGNKDGLVTVAWIWPREQNRTQWYGGGDVTFGYEPGQLKLASDHPLQQPLRAWVDQLERDGYGKPATSRYIGRTLYFSEIDKEIDLLCERLRSVLAMLNPYLYSD